MAHRHTLSWHIAPHIRNCDPILYRLVQLIPMLGVDARKMVLDVCQTARGPRDHDITERAVPKIISDLQLRQLDDIPSEFDTLEMLEHISSRLVHRSVVSMLLRNEVLDKLAGAEEVIEGGFVKEYNAGQNERPEELRISYQCLDQDNFAPADYSVYYPLTPVWTRYAQNLAVRFGTRLSKLAVLFPQVQRKKNMSQDTCRKLWEEGYRDGERDWKDFRTLDLELHKAATGQMIEGDCEMRMAWKFNELKPRFYYCIGGSHYWRARWIKKLAVELMESVDSTKMQRRLHPGDIEFSLEDDDWLAIWDMSSFTTSLSELRLFLYYIAKNLEENLYVQQHPLRCLDYQLGIVEITADKLLLQYNQGENEGAQFSIWRVLDRVFDGGEQDDRYTQRNSGMLGVPGNIGFSTAFHGFHAEAGIKKGTGCGVGDDALGGMKEDPRERFVPHIKLIGDLQEAKVDILPPLHEHEIEQISKFVKRRFTRSHYGITIGLLYAFPGFADVFGLHDSYHTLREDPPDKIIARFAGQVGSFFWDLHATGYIEPMEYDLINHLLKKVYAKLGLDSHGSLPGRKHRDFREGMMFAVPPLNFDFCFNDWAEWLWDNAIERWSLLPVFLGPLLVPPFIPGMSFIASEGGMLNVLDDLKCVKIGRMITEWVEVSVTNRRLFRSFLSGEKRSYQCQYLEFVPVWFDDVFSIYERVPMHFGL